VGLVISFIPALHEVANFSWFIGVFLGGATYRWLARDEREPPPRFPPAWRKKSNPSSAAACAAASPPQTGINLAQSLFP
jgi:hypothetical protein